MSQHLPWPPQNLPPPAPFPDRRAGARLAGQGRCRVLLLRGATPQDRIATARALLAGTGLTVADEGTGA